MTDWELIYLANMRPEVKALRKQMDAFRPLFSDMIMTGAWRIPYDKIIVNANTSQMSDDMNGCFCLRNYEKGFEVEIDIRTKTGKNCGPKLLHEMIHFHEICMNVYPESFRDHVEDQLKKKLDRRLNIDALIDLVYGDQDWISVFLRMFTFDIDTMIVPDFPTEDHGKIFFMKSLDLDIQRGYKLGTIYGYGMKEYLEKMI